MAYDTVVINYNRYGAQLFPVHQLYQEALQRAVDEVVQQLQGTGRTAAGPRGCRQSSTCAAMNLLRGVPLRAAQAAVHQLCGRAGMVLLCIHELQGGTALLAVSHLDFFCAAGLVAGRAVTRVSVGATLSTLTRCAGGETGGCRVIPCQMHQLMQLAPHPLAMSPQPCAVLPQPVRTQQCIATFPASDRDLVWPFALHQGSLPMLGHD